MFLVSLRFYFFSQFSTNSFSLCRTEITNENLQRAHPHAHTNMHMHTFDDLMEEGMWGIILPFLDWQAQRRAEHRTAAIVAQQRHESFVEGDGRWRAQHRAAHLAAEGAAQRVRQWRRLNSDPALRQLVAANAGRWAPPPQRASVGWPPAHQP